MTASQSTRLIAPRQPNVTCICPQCGTSFHAYASRVRDGKAKYCSQPCRQAGTSAKEARPCARCGKSVTRMRSRFEAPPERTFCGPECRNQVLMAEMDRTKPRRRTVCRSTENLPRGEDHRHWQGDAANAKAGRLRARRKYALGPCERCGKPATDRHHKDGVTTHNEPGNIAILCRRCHMEVDGRLEALVAGTKGRKRGERGRYRKASM